MEAAGSSETSVTSCESSRCHNAEDNNLYVQRRENLTSYAPQKACFCSSTLVKEEKGNNIGRNRIRCTPVYPASFRLQWLCKWMLCGFMELFDNIMYLKNTNPCSSFFFLKENPNYVFSRLTCIAIVLLQMTIISATWQCYSAKLQSVRGTHSSSCSIIASYCPRSAGVHSDRLAQHPTNHRSTAMTTWSFTNPNQVLYNSVTEKT